MKGIISRRLNNAAFDGAALQGSCTRRISKWLVCFEKLALLRTAQASFCRKKKKNLFKHSKLLAPLVWGINVNTLQDQEFILNS